ncbi:MAG: hypothetical protein HW403_762, partial [Dehalococcoidia bacterium]|nr:hypothetical protein [Dehalococcoidia bacterium]
MKFFNNGGKGSVPKRAEPGGALSRLLIKVYPNKTPSRNGQVRNGAVGNGEALKKRFLLLGGVTLGAAATLGVKYLANKWIKNGKSSNGAVDSLEMTADYAPDSPGTVTVYPKESPSSTSAHSNGAAAIVAPVSTVPHV